jgi:hypothetical protein
VVVAESFEEFLGLGCRIGWFLLEQLAYDPDWTVDHFAHGEPDSPECEAMLDRIRTVLRLRHVPLSLERMAQLKVKYLPLVQIPEQA